MNSWCEIGVHSFHHGADRQFTQWRQDWELFLPLNPTDDITPFNSDRLESGGVEEGVRDLLRGFSSWDHVCWWMECPSPASQGYFAMWAHMNLLVQVGGHELKLDVMYTFEEWMLL